MFEAPDSRPAVTGIARSSLRVGYNSRMTDFRTVKEAKDFLASVIAEEAARQNVPLSVVERKMLYWSETDWTLPDMKKAGDEFDRDYDQDEYEQKIARLIANITADRHHRNEAEEEKWDAAVEKLSDGDHYIQVLLREADRVAGRSGKPLLGGFLPALDQAAARRPLDILKLLVTSVVVIFTLIALIALEHHFFLDGFWRTLGSHIDNRAAPLLLVLALAGCFLFPKLWQFIRTRSNRP